MRIDVKKFLFIGMEEDRERFFEQAQQLGIIHFIDTHAQKIKQTPEDIQKLSSAIKVLRGLPLAEQEEIETYQFADDIVNEIVSLHDHLEKLREHQRVTKLEIARVDVFGDFSLDDITAIERDGNRVIQFFCAKKGSFDEQPLPDEVIYINSDHGLDYFVSIDRKTSHFENMIEMRIDQPVGVLKNRLNDIESQIHDVEQKLKTYSKYNTYLHHALTNKLNSYHLQAAQKLGQHALEGSLFSVLGWVPKDKMEQLQELTGDLKIHFEQVAVEDDDVVPTHLENSGVNRIGEDLVHIYDTPSNTDKDPSLWVLIFFALFFSLIISDGGYGIIYFSLALYMYYRAQKVTKGGRRLMVLVTILCSATLLWGVLSNSFFGINFSPDSPFRKVSLLQWFVNKKADYHISLKDQTYNEWLVKFPQLEGVNDYTEFLRKGKGISKGVDNYEILNTFSDNISMELALLIGVIHICLSFLRYLGRNWAGIGWVLAIIGAYFYIPYYLNVTSMTQFVLGINKDLAATEGAYLFMGGVGLAIVLSFIQNRLYGIAEITQIIQIFGDILSYLRLYALGLASSIISVTINEIAGSAGIVFGILILIIGHTVNMVLGVIGGVIHGLRLNFLEWYHYSFEGGGKLFAPLRKVEIE